MNFTMYDTTKIDALAEQAWTEAQGEVEVPIPFNQRFYRKFARLIAIEAAEAGDMARDADCPFIGDYIVEQLGFNQSIRHA
jgi:hypothetical protein